MQWSFVAVMTADIVCRDAMERKALYGELGRQTESGCTAALEELERVWKKSKLQCDL